MGPQLFKKYLKKLGNFGDMRLAEKVKGKGKGKAIPLQAWTGPEGSRRLRLPDSKTIDT
jgi:hypothetical protein